jgi:hypothetical protein
MNPYKTAPTWLYRGEEAKVFQTQEDVDRAWGDGWYGPKGVPPMRPLISSLNLKTKRSMFHHLETDARYSGIGYSITDTYAKLRSTIIKFEREQGLDPGEV